MVLSNGRHWKLTLKGFRMHSEENTRPLSWMQTVFCPQKITFRDVYHAAIWKHCTLKCVVKLSMMQMKIVYQYLFSWSTSWWTSKMSSIKLFYFRLKVQI